MFRCLVRRQVLGQLADFLERETIGGVVLGPWWCGCQVPWKILPLGGKIVLMRLGEIKVKAQLNALSR